MPQKNRKKQYVRHNQNFSLNQGCCGWFTRCFWVNCCFNFVRLVFSFGPRRGKTFGLGCKKKNMKSEKLNCLVNSEWNTLHVKLDNKQNEAHGNTLVKSFHSQLWFGWNKSSVHRVNMWKHSCHTRCFNRLSGLHVGIYVLIYGMYWSEWTAVPDTNTQPVNTEPHLAAEQSDIYIFLSSSWRSKTETH